MSVARARITSTGPAAPRNRWLARLAPLALAALATLGSAGTARAQSLYELYEDARKFDAPYLAARALADSVTYRAEQLHALRRPQVALTTNAGRTSFDLGANDSATRSGTVGVNGKQTLFNRANDKTIAQADKAVESARADVELAEQDLIVRVAQAYFDVLAAQEALAAAQANLKAIAEQLASAKRNFEVGTATITDTREAQARYDLATAQQLQADNDLRAKRIALDTLVGRNGVTPHPAVTPVPLDPLLPGSVEEWVTPTETGPSVRKQRTFYEQAQLETEKARAGNLPTVDLTAGVGRGNSQSTGLSSTPNGSANTSAVKVELNLPLFTGFSVQNRIKETLLLEEQQRELLEAARRKTAQDTRVAYFGVQSLQAQVKALEAAESSSLLALEATQLGYRVGVRVNLDVLNAQTQLFTTRRDLAKARYDLLVNSLRLRQAAGTLKPDDVLTISQLLVR
ncbi:MAG TPA: TolC family outer membrane protein [Albitalea sp.]|nr:TolC family outer membrane protein [Albitalea sp.]